MAFQQFPQKGGIPSGNTAARPSGPVVGDTFYNGQLGILEIFTAAGWQPCSAPPATPVTIVATDASTADVYSSTGGKLSVAFSAGSGGGLPTNYVAYTTAGGFSGSGASSPILLTGLTPGTSYAVYVVAQNGFGNSAASANSDAATPTTLPGVPTSVTATAASATSATIAWTAPATGGKAITQYTVTPFIGATAQTTTTTTGTSVTVTGLTGATTYTFKVKATNANGNSADSTASSPISLAITARVLILAGGGSAASSGQGGGSGGGGAGGLLYYGTETPKTVNGGELTFLTGTSYTVTVGGGTPVPTSGTLDIGRKGTNSSVVGTGISYTATGGGGAICRSSDTNVNNGGCGGGAGEYPNAGLFGTGISGQGFDGGQGATNTAGGGGGGTGQVGGNSGGSGGAGGNGLQYSITGTATYYGGGGGGSKNGGQGGAPGLGGGGDGGAGSGGSVYGSSPNGGTNLGGGGGGAFTSTPGAGGSGVVIISADGQAASTTGSPTTSTVSGRYVYKFTGTGSITF
jgi:hypothetical protein